MFYRIIFVLVVFMLRILLKFGEYYENKRFNRNAIKN